jgi:CRP-like cAMP-binding protein
MVNSTEQARASLIDAELKQLRTELQPLRLPAGAQVFEQGETGDRMLLITEGQVRSSIRLPDGTERTLSYAGTGDVVGEIALLTGARRAATVTTLTPVRGWTLDRHGYDLLRWDPSDAAIAFIERLVVLVAARLRESCTAIGRSSDDQSDSPVARLVSARNSAPMPSVEYLASLLCFTGFHNPEEVDTVVRDVPVEAAERGEILIEPGVQPPSLLLVTRGVVEVTVRQGNATRRVRLAGPGRFVGHNGILDEQPSPVIARARERTVLLAFPRERITRSLADPGSVGRALSAALLTDTARAVRAASRPMVATTART